MDITNRYTLYPYKSIRPIHVVVGREDMDDHNKIPHTFDLVSDLIAVASDLIQ